MDIIVSTDDTEIKNYSESLGVKVPFLRPKKLSNDTALSIDVLKHSIKFMEGLKQKKYNDILMLQPTSPLRNEKHINDSLKLYEENNVNSLVSVVSVDAYHPLRMKKIEGDYLINYIDQGFENMNPRKELPKVYIRSGAIYAILTKNFYEEQSLVSNLCSPIILDKIETINIDSPLDFEFCEFILKKTK